MSPLKEFIFENTAPISFWELHFSNRHMHVADHNQKLLWGHLSIKTSEALDA